MCIALCLGKKLSDLERVTSLKVYNWFANRRKEIKRRANIGNVEALWGQVFILLTANIMQVTHKPSFKIYECDIPEM